MQVIQTQQAEILRQKKEIEELRMQVLPSPCASHPPLSVLCVR